MGQFVVVNEPRCFQGYGCHSFVARCWDMPFVFASVPSIYLAVNTSLYVVVTECSCWEYQQLGCVMCSAVCNAVLFVQWIVAC